MKSPYNKVRTAPPAVRVAFVRLDTQKSHLHITGGSCFPRRSIQLSDVSRYEFLMVLSHLI